MAATMTSEIERLVLSPFKEILEKANNALENAEAADDGEVAAPMRKAAQNLAKEGERALKKIEPLCHNSYHEYGANFINAIKEHDDIAQFRSELDDLLWDFDDFVEVDEFDAEKFEDLQKASRKVAPKIMDILKRMKLEKPASPPQALKSPREDHIIVDTPISPTQTMDEVEQQLSEMLIMGSRAGPDPGVDLHPETRAAAKTSRTVSDVSSLSYHSNSQGMSLGQPPRPPSADPWLVDRPLPLSPSARSEDNNSIERRPPVGGDSPTLPTAVPLASQRSSTHSPHRSSQQNSQRSSTWAGGDNSRKSSLWRDSTATSSSSAADSIGRRPAYTNLPLPEPPRYSSQSFDMHPESCGSHIAASPPPNCSKPTSIIPEETAVGNYSSPPECTSITKTFPPRKASLATPTDHHPDRQPSVESFNSSIFDCVPFDGTTSPVTSTQRTSSVMSTTSGGPYSPVGTLPQYSPHPPIYANSARLSFPAPVGLIPNNSSATVTTVIRAPSPAANSEETVPATIIQLNSEDSGLIPVEAENREEPTMPTREPDCSIGSHSSFYQLKGFCKGAEEIMRGELGCKKIRRPVGGYSHITVAKCTHCLYELDFETFTRDLNNESTGNFMSNGIGFRLRFLQKSHLMIKHIEEQLYGCLFCIHEGKTLDESDATVFFNQKQLFAHIARHPRPLPAIPSVTVIDDADTAEDIRPPFRHNFDLHLSPRTPPLQTIMAGLAREIGRLPTAVAIETRRNLHAVMRVPPDRAQPLQYAVGARIVGVEFPDKYEGKWAIGWHDGVRAVFEMDTVRLDAPPCSETPMFGGGTTGGGAGSTMSGSSGGSGSGVVSSNVQAVARWKWSQKGEGRWLKFDKGDVIRNISWSSKDHWCWSGTVGSSRNVVYGIFPQSHLELDTMRAVRPDEAGSISSAERPRTSGLGRFSIRKNHSSSGESKKDKKEAKARVKKAKARDKAAVSAERTSPTTALPFSHLL